MKRLIYIFIIVLAVLGTSCNRKLVYEDERTFAADDWLRFQPETFQVPVRNVDDCYHICMDMWIDTAQFPEELLTLAINMTSPNNERRMFYGYVHVREKGRWQGEYEDGVLHVRQRIRQYFFFNVAGTHEVEIAQATHRYDLRGVKRIKFYVEKAELKYPE